MKFKMVHENYNVQDLQRSLDFYEAALGLKEKRRKTKKIALNNNNSRRFVAAGEGFEPSHTESESEAPTAGIQMDTGVRGFGEKF